MAGQQVGTGGAGWKLLPFLNSGLWAVMLMARPDSERQTQHDFVYVRSPE